nr:hypothetical protein [Tanacetum cinerariifolium]
SSTPPRYSPGASTPQSYSLGTSKNAECSNYVQRRSRYVIVLHYNDDSHIKGSSTPPRYSPGDSTPQSYSLGTSKNAECSNCKHFLDKIMVVEATVDMHPEQHTVNSAALFHEVYNNMRKLDLE